MTSIGYTFQSFTIKNSSECGPCRAAIPFGQFMKRYCSLEPLVEFTIFQYVLSRSTELLPLSGIIVIVALVPGGAVALAHIPFGPITVIVPFGPIVTPCDGWNCGWS